jgi:hypothetical protein
VVTKAVSTPEASSRAAYSIERSSQSPERYSMVCCGNWRKSTAPLTPESAVYDDLGSTS